VKDGRALVSSGVLALLTAIVEVFVCTLLAIIAFGGLVKTAFIGNPDSSECGYLDNLAWWTYTGVLLLVLSFLLV